MAKQSTIEQDGSIIEALSNAMFRVELENGHMWSHIFLEKCVCIISSYYLGDKVKLEMSPDLSKAKLLIDIKGYSKWKLELQ
jgi:translation initiation factor IF-1